MKRPAFQFYPGDWQRDAALRSCSVPARGLWIEMICVMHDAEPYGHLRVNGKPITVPTLARMVGATAKEAQAWLDELEGAGVFQRDDDGAILSRRMVRDERVRSARAAGGKLGGNPALKDGGKVGGKVNHPPNLPPTPSSASSSASSSSLRSDTSLRSDDATAEPAAKRPPPRTRLTLDGFPDDWRASAQRRLPGWDHDGLFRSFCDHHVGKGTTAASWPATWSTWLTNAPQFSRQFAPAGQNLTRAATPIPLNPERERNRQLAAHLTGYATPEDNDEYPERKRLG